MWRAAAERHSSGRSRARLDEQRHFFGISARARAYKGGLEQELDSYNGWFEGWYRKLRGYQK